MSVRTGALMPSTHVKARQAWWPPDCTPSVWESEMGEPQRKLVDRLADLASSRFHWEPLSQYLRWKAMEGNTWRQPWDSRHMDTQIHVHSCAPPHKNTLHTHAGTAHTNTCKNADLFTYVEPHICVYTDTYFVPIYIALRVCMHIHFCMCLCTCIPVYLHIYFLNLSINTYACLPHWDFILIILLKLHVSWMKSLHGILFPPM